MVRRRTLLIAVLCLLPAAVPVAAGQRGDDGQRQALITWVAGHQEPVLAELMDFLRLPNASSDTQAIAANAAALRTMWEKRGAQVRLLPGRGGPYVYAHLPAGPGSGPSPPTILFYAHYDGQPADPSRWQVTEPFRPRLVGDIGQRDSRLYGRSASDDKGPIVAMAAALDALAATGMSPAANLKFIFDPEEEVGSPHLEETLQEHALLLAADMLVFADGPVYPTGDSTVVFGTRGIITVRITVYGPMEPLHSGHYGNWAPNPAEKLARLLASLKDDQGRILVDGFHDDVKPLSRQEEKALANIPPIEGELQKRLLIARPDGGGRSLQELINQPSLNVRGMASAWVGDEARTIVPATATAEIDIRLVRDLDPEKQVALLRAHASRQGFHVVTEEPDAEIRRRAQVAWISHGPGTPALRTPMTTPMSLAVIDVVTRASGREPVLLPTLGGTVPLSRLQSLLGGLPVYGLPMVNADNNQHAPDENLRLGNLWDGILLYASMMRFQVPAATP